MLISWHFSYFFCKEIVLFSLPFLFLLVLLPNSESQRPMMEETPYLPPHLITEIVLRLPIKFLVRFKCVSKSMFSLISEPHFAISQFQIPSPPTHRLALLAASTREFLSVDFNASLLDDSSVSHFNLDEFMVHDYVLICGSCRGFLLLDLGWTLCVWNPATGFHKLIKWPPFVSANNIRWSFSDDFHLSLSGFGYDSSTDDYLIFLAWRDDMDVAHHMDYFSIRTNQWKNLEPFPLSSTKIVPVDSKSTGSLLNGSIHWLIYANPLNVIVALDITTKTLSEVSLPLSFNLNTELNPHALMVLGEMLHLCTWTDASSSIWVMKEYKLQSSWTKIIVVPISLFRPLCYTTSGDIVFTVGIFDCVTLVKCNNKGQVLQLRSYSAYARSCTDWGVYRESLLSLPCDTIHQEESGSNTYEG